MARHATNVLDFESRKAATQKAVGDGEKLYKTFAADVQLAPNEDSRCIKFVISTQDADRDNDCVMADGWDLSNYLRNPVVLWAHSHSELPVGKAVSIGLENGKLVATCEFATAEENPKAEQVYRLYKRKFLSATSVGFRALEATPNVERQGIDFKRQELLEFSCVPVPANQHALVAAEAEGVDTTVVKDWFNSVRDALPLRKDGTVTISINAHTEQASKAVSGLSDAVTAASAAADSVLEKVAKLTGALGHVHTLMDTVEGHVVRSMPERWNLRLSKAFDVANATFPAQSLEQELASKYIGAPLSQLAHGATQVRSARMGAFLTALEEFVTADAVHVDALRNISAGGHEAPPYYEDIQLNSKEAKNFLVDGMRFLTWNGEKMCLRVEPRWYGLEIAAYSVRSGQQVATKAVLQNVKDRAKQLNFLRGEAFALSGEFLERGSESLDDLILEDKNAAVVQRLVTLVTDKGADMDPRGVLLLGPPGTGKTLSGRILMNKTPSTFIWVSSRDMAYGASSAIEEAFDMARECAPSIIFFEDVDNWIDRGTVIDLLKTELDGIKQNKGVLTALTTNYPERLPKALIDRPGRFHDVLRFGLPNEKQRELMLRKWVPGLADADVTAAVTATDGMSGAHMRELARFAGIIAEQDKLAQAEALTKALEKLQEQRDLITAVQAGGAFYRAPAAVLSKTVHKEDVPVEQETVLEIAEPTPALELELAEEPTLDIEEDTLDIEPETVRAMLHEAVGAALQHTTRAAVASAINQLRGRID